MASPANAPRRSPRGPSSRNSIATSSASARPSAPWPWPCAIAGAGSRCLRPCATRSRLRTSCSSAHGRGKTEIAAAGQAGGRPFVKVEASKFTEVGYVGRDVDSMVRDLAETAVSMLREEERERARPRARENAEERLLDVLLPPARPQRQPRHPWPARRQRPRKVPPRPQRPAARAKTCASSCTKASLTTGPSRSHQRHAPVVHRCVFRHRHGGDGCQPAVDVPPIQAHQATATEHS